MIGQRARRRPERKSLMTQYADGLGNAVMRHRAELALKTATVEAELSSRARAAFIANMSHELRTPLNAIIGFSDVLRGPPDEYQAEEKVQEYSEYIHTSAVSLLDMINRLLELTKIHSGSVKVNYEAVDIAELVRLCIDEFRPRAEQAGITLESDTSAVSSMIHADQAKMQQILRCLIDNGIKFTDEGGRVDVSVSPAVSGRMSVTISDSGCGMTEDEIELATSRFSQIDSGLNRKHEGTGLGLPIAKSLCEIQGGVLAISSEVARGTKVVVTMQVAMPQKPASNIDPTAETV